MNNYKKLLRIGKKYTAPILGFAALIWFLIRVIPKPSRAFYPCQRAAFPLASAFVIWIISSVGSIALIKKSISSFSKRKYFSASVFSLSGLTALIILFTLPPDFNNYATSKQLQKVIVPEMKSLVDATTNKVSPVSTVSIVKSEKAKAEDLTYDDIKKMVIKSIEDAGGLKDIITNGDTVVLKPNLVYNLEGATWKPLDSEVNGITTDWRIVKAVSEIVRALNPGGKIFVMEGSAASTQTLYDMMNYNRNNMPEVNNFYCLESTSGSWKDYSAAGILKTKLPEGKNLYPDSEKPYNSADYYFNKIYYNANVLISISNLKNHESASVTGSIKNLSIGATPANIYGKSEKDNNRSRAISHTTYMHEFIHDYYLCRKADFAILDGLQGLEYGPMAITGGKQSYKASKKNMRLLLASKDLVALDAIESLLMTYDPEKVKYLVQLHNDNAGCADPSLIKVVGQQVGDERIDFQHNTSTSPKFIDNIPPNFEVSKISLVNQNELQVDLGFYENIDKIEISVNDKSNDKIFVNDFARLNIDVSGISIDNSTKLKITAYNKYLAYKELNFVKLTSGEIISKADPFEESTVRVYPTIVENALNIEGIKQNSILGIYSLSGKLVKNELIYDSQQANINLNYLQPGMYVINITHSGKTEFSGKIMKK